MISVTALAGVPARVRAAFGERVLQQANRAAMIDIEQIEDGNCFIPHTTMTTFLAEVERLTGEMHLGLLLAPHLTLADYGCWGGYVLGGGTLGEALARGTQTIGYHSQGDRTALGIENGIARFGYFSAARGHAGYRHVAIGAVGVILNLCRAYLTPDWRPATIMLDVPRPRRTGGFEDAFGCPVVFDAPFIAVCFAAHQLDSHAPRRAVRDQITLGEVARARQEPASRANLTGVVSAQIWTQIQAGEVSIDSAARALDMSIRSLQRALDREGTDFRALTGAIRIRRASELLGGTGASVTDIALDLGYTSPANFARAFRKATGRAPGEFRRQMPAQTEGEAAPPGR